MRGITAALLLALACSSCSTPTAVTPQLSATYVLASASGSALPIVISKDGGERHTLHADTLRFEPDGLVHLTAVIGFSGSPSLGARDSTYARRITLQYVIEGCSFVMGRLTPCPPNANCVGPESGSIDAKAVTFGTNVPGRRAAPRVQAIVLSGVRS